MLNSLIKLLILFLIILLSSCEECKKSHTEIQLIMMPTVGADGYTRMAPMMLPVEVCDDDANE